MKHNFLIILILSLLIYNCKNDIEEPSPDEFLSKNNINLSEIHGTWTWNNSHGGGWGMTILTPESEGFSKQISFEADRKFKEFIDSEITIDTYYRIDSTGRLANGLEIYKIYRFIDKEEQEFVINQEDDTTYLYLYDLNCRDCIGTHVYLKD
ncbi:hypothetical protein [Roseimarinus sediminis]|uniref:hypothetical protein n=1 Tax=Roseimarinus sediminis TaxID=1610899 RepID=UPI003D224B4F